jgi:HEAT repeat protein
MKALEALRDSAGDEAVRETLLQALQHDPNPGVRVEAVNLLVHSLEGDVNDGTQVVSVPRSSDAVVLDNDDSVVRVVRALEDLQRRDPNRYVRLRSAAALRQISARDIQ